MEGTFGFSALRIWRSFGSILRFSHLNTVFGFGVLCGLQVFSNLVRFGFQFSSAMMAVFRIFPPNAFYSFSGFAKGMTPHSRAKTVIPLKGAQEVRGIHENPSLFGIIQVVMAAKQTMKSLIQIKDKNQVTSKQKTISQILATGIIYCGIWPETVGHRRSISQLRVVSPFRRGNNIGLSRSVHVE